MNKKSRKINARYGEHFGIGLVAALTFVLVMFNMSFENNLAKAVEVDLVGISNFVPIDSRQLEQEKREKIDKKMAIEVANEKLMTEFKDEIEPDLVEAKTSSTVSTSKSSEPISIAPTFGKTEKKTPPRIIPKKKEENVHPVMIAEVMPRFKDCPIGPKGRLGKCTTEKLLAFIFKQINYPLLARETGKSGKVIAQFIIEKDGRVGEVTILRSPGGGLGQETKRVLKLLPEWIPGYQQGNAVSVKYVIPVIYCLE